MPLSLVRTLVDDLSDNQASQLTDFHNWLASEGVAAGGIGPDEVDRIWSRHIADGAAFSAHLPPVTDITDLGTGVGLPGLVLAVLRPDTPTRLVDRSGRRIRLLNRAIRVLGVDNAVAIQRDILDPSELCDGVVMRAVFPPADAIRAFATHLSPTGTGLLGLSRTQEPDFPALLATAQTHGLSGTAITESVLDPPAWMLMMSVS